MQFLRLRSCIKAFQFALLNMQQTLARPAAPMAAIRSHNIHHRMSLAAWSLGHRSISGRAPSNPIKSHRIGVRAAAAAVLPESEVEQMSSFLDSLKWDTSGLVVAIAQHVDTGEVLMQAFADRSAVNETLQTGMATFYSRSRKGRWCKGETSGHFIKVIDVFMDCDRDSIIYLSEPIGPACHTNAPTCYFTQISLPSDEGALLEAGEHTSRENSPMTTLFALERTIEERRTAAAQPGAKPSWTAKLLSDPELLCKKIREEAGELCETWEKQEGKERAASEAADLIYHAMVMLNVQGVKLEDVSAVLRSRFGTSGIDEKAGRKPKAV